MSTFQKVIIIGYLGDAPQTKFFEGGSQLSVMSIATTEHWTDKSTNEKKELTEWHRVVVNGKLSELADKYLSKGSKVLIEGKLRTRKWQDQSGADKYTTEIIGREMTFMSKAESNSPSGGNSAPSNDLEDKDDDLPF